MSDALLSPNGLRRLNPGTLEGKDLSAVASEFVTEFLRSEVFSDFLLAERPLDLDPSSERIIIYQSDSSIEFSILGSFIAGAIF